MLVMGDQRPRLESIPPYVSSKAEDTIALSHEAGLDLDPWQEFCLTGALGIQPNGKWSAFEVKILVSRQNGKGSILEARELGGLYLFKTDRLLIHTAHQHKTASEHYQRIWSLISQTPDLSRRLQRHSSAYGREFIQLRPGPTVILGSSGREVLRQESSRLVFIARTGSSGRGFTADYLNYDEDMTLDSGEVGSSLPSLSARPNPQVWYTGSAGTKKSTQLAHVRRRGVASAEGSRPTGRLFFVEWSIDWHLEECGADCKIHDDPDSVEALARANPGLGIRLSMDVIEAEKEALTPEERLRERLGVGIYPAPLDAWLVIPKKWFDATKDQSEEPARVARPVFA